MAPYSARILVALALGLGGGTATAQEFSAATVVLFDSVCLTCHEGECSGRMALRTSRSEEGLAGHVTGYAGPTSAAEVGALKTLMSRLKTECRLPAPPAAIPADGGWSAADLAALQLADRTRAFIPLGAAEAGERTVTLRLAQAQRLRVQIVAADFDILFDQELEIGPAGVAIRWSAAGGTEEFLRLLARAPMTGLSLGR